MSREKKITLSISVHQLVDFLLRQGDIDTRVYNAETMSLGSKIHSGYQKKQGNTYLSEVPLKEVFSRTLGTVSLEGRADGIIVGGVYPVVDEIKSTISDLSKFYEQQSKWHFGQAECYALMYLHKVKEEKICIRLTYISQVKDETLIKEKVFSLQELEEDVSSYLDEFLTFQLKIWKHQAKRDQSAKKISFPYDNFRDGQREMARYVYGTANKGGVFFVEAPTGIGKTMSALFPATKSFSKGKIDKIFYLTAKSTGRETAFFAVTRLKEKGLIVFDSLLKAKDKICFRPGKGCNPDECPFAKDYYTKVRSVIDEALDSNRSFDPSYVVELASFYSICPFELQLDLSIFADIVIMDYNYLFDPLTKLERFFDPSLDSSKYFALIDEAHNLVERGRDSYSSLISLSSLENASSSLRHLKRPKIKRALLRIKKGLSALLSENSNLPADIKVLGKELSKGLTNLSESEREDRHSGKGALPQAFKDFSREAYRFSFLLENYFAHSSLFLEKDGEDIRLRLFCLDPSEYLKTSISALRGAAIFSATLSPIDYYMESIMGEANYPCLVLPSPFPKENMRLILVPSLSIKFKDRAHSLGNVVSCLESFVKAKKGNYFIYLPSYTYLDAVERLFAPANCRVFSQHSEMSEEERRDFLLNFAPSPEKTTIGLLVLGGAFGEGIDLVADRLIGVAVVGVGLSTLSHERGLISDYFTKQSLDGFGYAYRNPAMNKVMQAVGRLIRSEKDVGSALLIDERYMHDEYRDLFLTHYPSYSVSLDTNDISMVLKDFYEKE